CPVSFSVRYVFSRSSPDQTCHGQYDESVPDIFSQSLHVSLRSDHMRHHYRHVLRCPKVYSPPSDLHLHRSRGSTNHWQPCQKWAQQIHLFAHNGSVQHESDQQSPVWFPP